MSQQPLTLEQAIVHVRQRVRESVNNGGHFSKDVLAQIALLTEIKRLTHTAAEQGKVYDSTIKR